MATTLTTPPKQDDPAHVREIETLTIELERMIARGEDETAEGEQLRDRMEAIWWQLSSQTQKRVERLAVDLGSLFAPVAELASNGTAEDAAGVSARIDAAVAVSAWDDALQYLRSRSSYAPHHVARLRSAAYDALGFRQAALLFEDQAKQLEGQLAAAA